MGKASQNDDQQRLSELEWQHAHGGRHADPAGRRFAAIVLDILVPSRLMIVEGEATNMLAIKPNKLAEHAHARVFASGPVCAKSSSGVDRLHRSLPEQAFDKLRRSRMVAHDSIVSRQRQPEPAQVGLVGETVA
jgi:hypothetical protein